MGEPVIIPPPGPERDRLVAEAAGWEWVGPPYIEKVWDAAAKVARKPSTKDPDALAALEAWRVGAKRRSYRIFSAIESEGDWCVTLFLWDTELSTCDAPTLRDAATAALVRWSNERSTA